MRGNFAQWGSGRRSKVARSMVDAMNAALGTPSRTLFRHSRFDSKKTSNCPLSFEILEARRMLYGLSDAVSAYQTGANYVALAQQAQAIVNDVFGTNLNIPLLSGDGLGSQLNIITDFETALGSSISNWTGTIANTGLPAGFSVVSPFNANALVGSNVFELSYTNPTPLITPTTFATSGQTGFPYLNGGSVFGAITATAPSVTLKLTVGVDLPSANTPTFFIATGSGSTGSQISINNFTATGSIGGSVDIGQLGNVSVAGSATVSLTQAALTFTDPRNDGLNKARAGDFNSSSIASAVTGSVTGTVTLAPSLTASLSFLPSFTWNPTFSGSFSNGNWSVGTVNLNPPSVNSILTSLGQGFLSVGEQLLGGGAGSSILGPLAFLQKPLPLLDESIAELTGLDSDLPQFPSFGALTGAAQNVLNQLYSWGFKVNDQPTAAAAQSQLPSMVQNLVEGNHVDLISWSTSGYVPLLDFNAMVPIYGINIADVISAGLFATFGVNAELYYNLGIGIDTHGFYLNTGPLLGVTFGANAGIEGDVSVFGFNIASAGGDVGLSITPGVTLTAPSWDTNGRVYAADLALFGSNPVSDLVDALGVDLQADFTGDLFASVDLLFWSISWNWSINVPVFDIHHDPQWPATNPNQIGGGGPNTQMAWNTITVGGQAAGPNTSFGSDAGGGTLTFNDSQSISSDILRLIEGPNNSVTVDWLGGASAPNVGGSETFEDVGTVDFIGSKGDDQLTVSPGFNIPINATSYSPNGSGGSLIQGGSGGNTLIGGAGHDTLIGGSGNDSLTGGSGNSVIIGNDGNDTISAGNGNTEVVTGAGATKVFGGSGADTIDTGNGNDTIFGGSGNFQINAGSGNNLIFGYASGTGAVAAASATPPVINTGSGNDTIYGGDVPTLINGQSGSDTIYGGSGWDTIYGGTGGNNLIMGAMPTAWSQQSAATSSGLATLTLASDSSIGLFVGEPVAGSGIQPGSTITNINSSGSTVVITLSNVATATSFSTQLTFGGNMIYGGGSGDTLIGGSGNNTLTADSGSETLYGGTGNDVSINSLGTGVTYTNGSPSGTGSNLLLGGSGADLLIADSSGTSTLDAGSGNDTLYAGPSGDYLAAGTGIDALYGGPGNDSLAAAFNVVQLPGSASETGNVVTLVVPGLYTVGQSITVLGISPSGYDGTFTIASVGNGYLTYTAAAGLGSATISAAAQMRAISQDTLDGGAGLNTLVITPSTNMALPSPGLLTSSLSNTSGTTYVNVSNGSVFNTLTLPQTIEIDNEQMEVTAVSGNTLTLQRNSSSPAYHFAFANAGVLEDPINSYNTSITVSNPAGITSLPAMIQIDGEQMLVTGDAPIAATGTIFTGSTVNVSSGSLTVAGSVGNVSMNASNGFVAGQTVNIAGTNAAFDGTWLITAANSSSFSYSIANYNTSNSPGYSIASEPFTSAMATTNSVITGVSNTASLGVGDQVTTTATTQLSTGAVITIIQPGTTISSISNGIVSLSLPAILSGSASFSVTGQLTVTRAFNGAANQSSHAAGAVIAPTQAAAVQIVASQQKTPPSYFIGFTQTGTNQYQASLSSLNTSNSSQGGLLGLMNVSVSSDIQEVAIQGGQGNNVIKVDPSVTRDMFLYGGPGNNTLYGGSGNDTLVAGPGSSVLYGGSNNSVLYGGDLPSQDAQPILASNQNLNDQTPTPGNDTLIAGGGSDELYAGAGNDVLIGGNAIYASGNYVLGQTSGSDTLVGGSGNDLMIAGPGSPSSVMFAGTGSDTLARANAGRDVLEGSSGVSVSANASGSTISITGQNTSAAEIEIGDAVSGVGIPLGDTVASQPSYNASNQVTTITLLVPVTQAENSIVFTFDGNDLILGDNLTNDIIGGAGNDTLVGGTGVDYIQAGTTGTGTGNQTLYGAGDNAGWATAISQAQRSNVILTLPPNPYQVYTGAAVVKNSYTVSGFISTSAMYVGEPIYTSNNADIPSVGKNGQPVTITAILSNSTVTISQPAAGNSPGTGDTVQLGNPLQEFIQLQDQDDALAAQIEILYEIPSPTPAEQSQLIELLNEKSFVAQEQIGIDALLGATTAVDTLIGNGGNDIFYPGGTGVTSMGSAQGIQSNTYGSYTFYGYKQGDTITGGNGGGNILVLQETGAVNLNASTGTVQYTLNGGTPQNITGVNNVQTIEVQTLGTGGSTYLVTTNASSNVISNLPLNGAFYVGQAVIGTGIPVDTYITGFPASGQATLSQAATVSSLVAGLTFAADTVTVSGSSLNAYTLKVVAGSGNDFISAPQFTIGETLVGGSGNDTIQMGSANATDTAVTGGTGNSELDILCNGSTNTVSVFNGQLNINGQGINYQSGATISNGNKIVTGLQTGSLLVGQSVTGLGVNAIIQSILSPTSISLSAAANQSSTAETLTFGLGFSKLAVVGSTGTNTFTSDGSIGTVIFQGGNGIGTVNTFNASGGTATLIGGTGSNTFNLIGAGTYNVSGNSAATANNLNISWTDSFNDSIWLNQSGGVNSTITFTGTLATAAILGSASNITSVSVKGGNGNNMLDASKMQMAVSLNGGAGGGADSLYGGSGNDTLYVSGNNSLDNGGAGSNNVLEYSAAYSSYPQYITVFPQFQTIAVNGILQSIGTPTNIETFTVQGAAGVVEGDNTFSNSTWVNSVIASANDTNTYYGGRSSDGIYGTEFNGEESTYSPPYPAYTIVNHEDSASGFTPSSSDAGDLLWLSCAFAMASNSYNLNTFANGGFAFTVVQSGLVYTDTIGNLQAIAGGPLLNSFYSSAIPASDFVNTNNGAHLSLTSGVPIYFGFKTALQATSGYSGYDFQYWNAADFGAGISTGLIASGTWPVVTSPLIIGAVTLSSASGGVVTGIKIPWSDPNSTAVNDIVTVDWGDGTFGSFSNNGSSGNYTISANHIYSKLGTYNIVINVIDPAGTAAVASTTFTGGLNLSSGAVLNFNNSGTITQIDSGVSSYFVRESDLQVFALHPSIRSGQLTADNGVSSFIANGVSSIGLGADGNLYALQPSLSQLSTLNGSSGNYSLHGVDGATIELMSDSSGTLYKLDQPNALISVYTLYSQTSASAQTSTPWVLDKSDIVNAAITSDGSALNYLETNGDFWRFDGTNWTLISEPTVAPVVATSATAGQASTVTIAMIAQNYNASDGKWDIPWEVTNYTGTVSFSSSDPAAALPSTNLVFNNSNPSQAVYSVTFKTETPPSIGQSVPGTQRLSVTAAFNDGETPLPVSGSAIVTVNPSTPVGFTVVPVVTSAVAGAPFGVTVTAVDAFGNPVNTITGTVNFFTNDSNPNRNLPGSYNFTTGLNGDNGSHVFPITLITEGGERISVNSSTGNLTGTGQIAILPGAFSAAMSTITAGPTALTSSASSNTSSLTLVARDKFGNPLTTGGLAVLFEVTSGSGGYIGQLSDPNNPGGYVAFIDNSNGTYSGVFDASAATGTSTIGALVNNQLVGSTSSVAINPLNGYASYYLKLDADGQHIDVWYNLTGSGMYSQQIMIDDASTLNITAAGGGTIVLDASNGDYFSTGGINITGGGGTTLEVIGTNTADNVAVSTGTLSFDGNSINYSGVSNVEFNPDGGYDSVVVNSGTLIVPAQASGGLLVRQFSSINVQTGAKLQFASPSNHTNRALIVSSSITIAGSVNAWTGTLDLGGNDLDIPGASLATVTNEIAQGYNGGSWTGAGIDSLTAAIDPTHLTALGIIINNLGGSASLYGSGGTLGMFDGYNAAATDVLIKYTYYGDALLQGRVNGTDYSRIDNGSLTNGLGWVNGDFNYDGLLNGSDYTLIDNAFNTQGAQLTATIAAQVAAPNVAAPLVQVAVPQAQLVQQQPAKPRRIVAMGLADAVKAKTTAVHPAASVFPIAAAFADSPIIVPASSIWADDLSWNAITPLMKDLFKLSGEDLRV